MSRLYLSEEGMVIPTLCEELTSKRRARKILQLPNTHSNARLFISAYAYPGTNWLLHVSVNQVEIESILPSPPSIFHWYEAPVPAGLLRDGENQFEFWTDAPAMNAWALALEGGFDQPNSQISSDGGLTWRNHHMGYLNATRGEYLVRVRLNEDQDPFPPAWIPEDSSSPYLKDLLQRIPQSICHEQTQLKQVRSLASWISTSWEYCPSTNATQYTPWDIDTILAWGKSKQGHNGRLPIVMCVQYGVAFMSACQALGLQARAAVFTENITGLNGHFAAEVWFPDYNKWVYVDPNIDLLFFKDDIPLSVPEIRTLIPDLSPYFSFGPGLDYQLRNPLIQPFIDQYPRGAFMKHRSLWWRADFLSSPTFCPPGHGSLCYSEIGLVWERKDLDDGMAMFPYFGDEEYFDAPPI